MIVLKFGGTSVRDAGAMSAAARIVTQARERHPLVVLSACAGVTQALLQVAECVRDGRTGRAVEKAGQLQRFHVALARELCPGNGELQLALENLFQGLQERIAGVSTRAGSPEEESDAIVAVGELASSRLLHALLAARGLSAEWVDARGIVATDDHFGRALPQADTLRRNAEAQLQPLLDRGRIVVTQGFIGATPDGRTTTIGRGGSDWTATLLGAALGAECIEIWTDTDGILTCDPAVIPGAKPVPVMTFDEAAEMAHFGAKVLHPDTIDPARLAGIPVRVLNSARPGCPGTAIGFPGLPAEPDSASPRGIAFKSGVTIVRLRSRRQTPAFEFLAATFAALALARTSVAMIATSGSGVTFTVDNPADLERIRERLLPVATVETIPDRALVAVIGRFKLCSEHVSARVFAVLAALDIQVDLVSYGGAEINLALALRADRMKHAVAAIHAAFFEAPEAAGIAAPGPAALREWPDAVRSGWPQAWSHETQRIAAAEGNA